MGFSDYGLDYGNPDFVAYADSYGAKGHRVSSVEDLASTLKRCLDKTGVQVIDIAVDYSENQRILNQEIPEKSRKLSFGHCD
jgi:acetolactate synthase-1/2/3 large subunit